MTRVYVFRYDISLETLKQWNKSLVLNENLVLPGMRFQIPCFGHLAVNQELTPTIESRDQTQETYQSEDDLQLFWDNFDRKVSESVARAQSALESSAQLVESAPQYRRHSEDDFSSIAADIIINFSF